MRWIALLAAAIMLTACAAAPVNEMPAAAAPAPAAQPPREAEAEPARPLNEDGTPLERHAASAQCWMRYDRSGGTLEAKARLVEKCINDKMAGTDTRDTKKKGPAR